MESFYRQMRRRHDVLMDNGKPAGGKWNYDQSNRQRYDGAVPLPEICAFSNDASDIVAMIDSCQVPTFGRDRPQTADLAGESTAGPAPAAGVESITDYLTLAPTRTP